MNSDKEHIKEKCSVVVSTCDKYVDLMNGFFVLFRKYWSDCPYPIYLNLEHEVLNYEGVTSINSGETFWCRRLRNVVNVCNTDYIILLLDDFYIEDKVNQSAINQCIDEMDKNHNIVSFVFDRVKFDNEESYLLNFQKRKRFGKYRHALQAGIWRKDYLMRSLDIDANAWEYEYVFNFMSFNKNYIFYCLKQNEPDIIPYGHGWLVVKGKYVKEEIDRILSNNGDIGFDYSKREIIEAKDAGEDFTIIFRIIRRLKIHFRRLKYILFRK